MPELPEVETTRRGIAPHVEGRRIARLTLRETRLRWPVLADLPQRARGQRVGALARRGKYLLMPVGEATLIWHLGMSGSLRLCDPALALRKHDHLLLDMEDGHQLRFHDPRRFGAAIWHEGDPLAHSLLSALGPEPLAADFDGAYLYARSRGRRIAVKAFVMDSQVVVGVGNIYANEALALAGIDPRRAAGAISAARYQHLAQAIREVLARAIDQGGTTLRDFVNGVGEPGYFAQQLQVYGRAGQPCLRCAQPLRMVLLGQRQTVFCSRCQR